MLKEIYALKTEYEQQMFYVKAKLEVVDDLIERLTAHTVSTEESETDELDENSVDENSVEDEFKAV